MGKKIGSIAGGISGGLTGGGFLGSIVGSQAGGMIGGAVGGDLTDMFDDVTDSTNTSTVNLRNFEDLARGRSGLEAGASATQQSQFDELSKLLGGNLAQEQGDMAGARTEATTLMDMLRQAQRGPSSQNINDAQSFAQSIFAPQQQALQQQFQQAETDTSRLAARLGRTVDDPVLRAKLAQSQGQQMGQLQAQQGAFTAQAAQGFQQQGLGMQEQLMGIRGGLATQALQNRQALMGMGQQLVNQERQFRLGTATQTGTARQVNQGGIGDVIGAVTGGIGAFMGMPK